MNSHADFHTDKFTLIRDITAGSFSTTNTIFYLSPFRLDRESS